MSFLETRSISYSIALHTLLVLFAVVGIPAILPEKSDPQPTVISVEMLPITDRTNVKPSDKPIQKEQKANNPATKKPVEQTSKEPPKPTPTPPEPKQKSEPAPKEPEKHFDPTEGDKPKPKEEKPKEEAKKPEPTKAQNDEFAALLNKLKQEAKTEKDKNAKDATTTQENKTKSNAAYDDSLPLSLSEKDAIRGQLETCWNKTSFAGAKDPASLIVIIHIIIEQDGTVSKAELDSSQQGKTGDPYFRAAADAAVRAAQRCSPLKNLPADKYGSWHETQVTFDPRD